MTYWKLIRSIRAAAVVTALCTTSIALADRPPPDDKPAADNTARNDADKSRQGAAPTADQSKNDKSDVELAAKIRRSVFDDKDLSISAHNVKIIVESGHVTLKGPVKTKSEKMTVAKKATDIAGVKNVRNEIEIAP